MKHKKSGVRTFLIVLCVLLGIVLAAMLAATIYFNSLLSKIQKGEDVPLTPEQIEMILGEETEDPANNTAPEMDESDVDWGENEGNIIKTSDNIVNILLIGQDARPGWGRSRSDTILLVTFNKESKTITLTSFLRDLYVKIPGRRDDKINVAYLYGGMELLNDTLEQNFGVQVDGNVEVDFSRFAEVIDLLGGVEIELRGDEANYINRKLGNAGIQSDLTAGVHNLNGDQALWYSRIRYLDADADLSRTNRQRKVVNSLIEKFRDAKLTTLLGLMDDLLPMIATDMSNAQLLGYATELFPMLADCTIVSQRIPGDNAFQFKTIRGMACVVADMDAARELLEKTMGE